LVLEFCVNNSEKIAKLLFGSEPMRERSMLRNKGKLVWRYDICVSVNGENAFSFQYENKFIGMVAFVVSRPGCVDIYAGR